jgi:hypothetical protein
MFFVRVISRWQVISFGCLMLAVYSVIMQVSIPVKFAAIITVV